LSDSVTTLNKRRDFLRAASARRQGTPGFLLQARPRDPSEPCEGARVGFTCSKKRVTGCCSHPRKTALARNCSPDFARSRARRLGLCACGPPYCHRDTRLCADAGRFKACAGSRAYDAMTPLAHLIAIPVRAYRLLLSPWIGHGCRFQPTCSVYALEALERHGPWRGTFLMLRRLGRCHPWGGSGYDPVPPRGKGGIDGQQGPL
jgi:uncharacterized protein